MQLNIKKTTVPSRLSRGRFLLLYNPALDGLRAISILAVVAFHSKVPLLGGGFFGVDLFFVLSGFLITTILHNELEQTKGVDLSRFYWNRLVRLTPPLYLMLAAVLLIGVATPGKTLVAAVYLTDFSTPYERSYGVLGHAWSLAVEEQFYLVWPLLLAGILRLPRPVAVIVALFCVATVWRLLLLQDLPHRWVYYRPDARLTGLLAGAIVALAKPEFQGHFPAELYWQGCRGRDSGGHGGLAYIFLALIGDHSDPRGGFSGSPHRRGGGWAQ